MGGGGGGGGGGGMSLSTYGFLSHKKHAYVRHIIMIHDMAHVCEALSHETVALGFERFESLKHNKKTLMVMGNAKET